MPSACWLYGRNGERFIKARIVIPDSTFCSVVGTGQVVINLIGHCQSLDCASINARTELVTVKVDGFKAGYQTVRIEELRHTKHPVRVMANLSDDIIWPYRFSVEDFRLFWCKDGGCKVGYIDANKLAVEEGGNNICTGILRWRKWNMKFTCLWRVDVFAAASRDFTIFK